MDAGFWPSDLSFRLRTICQPLGFQRGTVDKYCACSTKPRRPLKTKTPDLFTATVHQILRAAQAEGATAEVVTASFLRALEIVYGPNPLSRPAAKLSWRRTPRAMAASKEDWRDLDRAALARVRKGIAQAGAGQTHDLGSFARYSGNRITASQRRRLVTAIDARIAHHRRCRSLLRHVTADVLSAGRDIFTSEAALVLWLCEPANALDGATPISQMRQAKGRARVVNILRALAHGVYL